MEVQFYLFSSVFLEIYDLGFMGKNLINNIIFDLDGTLIDSSTGILGSLANAFSSCNLDPIRPFSADIIGPPLMETLSILSGISDKDVLNELAEEFKSHYDTFGYKKTIVFPGINEMLRRFRNSGLHMYIATNKRILPTNKIINYLKWNKIFEGIYSLDSYLPSASSKSEVLSKLVKDNNLKKGSVIYIGDHEEDNLAAIASNIPFLIVSWGYDEAEENLINKDKINTPNDLYNQLLVKN